MIRPRAFTLWFTGLSGAGKTTLANYLALILKEHSISFEKLDGDIFRKMHSKDLGFSKEDRDKNIKRVVLMAQMFNQKGVSVLASFISPYRHQREFAKQYLNPFVEIYVNTPLAVCEQRDVKGLYQKARQGELQNFTGISAPYEVPEKPDLIVDTVKNSVSQNCQQIISFLESKEWIHKIQKF